MSKECSTCTRPSNNKYFDCPVKMQDGRNFTDYRPRCIANALLVDGNVFNSYQYRQYLMANANNIMQANSTNAYEYNKCGPCMDPYIQGTMLPEKTIMKCNASVCQVYNNDINGVGMGRQYTDSDSTDYNTFIANKNKEQEYMKQNENCCTNKIDDMNYYPFDYSMTNIVNERPVVPSGGYALQANDRH